MAPRTRKAKGTGQALQVKKSRFAGAREVVAELKKAHWPTRQEALRLSGLVLVICVVVGVILGLFDWGFSELITKVFLGVGN
jgi:preprotein translocase subunit SecE